MDITCFNTGDAVIEVMIKGEFNTYEVENFQKSIQNLMQDNTKGLIIDLSQVPYMTSAALRALCILGKSIIQGGLKFVICGLTGLSKEVFFVSGFHQVFPPAENLEAARQRVKI